MPSGLLIVALLLAGYSVGSCLVGVLPRRKRHPFGVVTSLLFSLLLLSLAGHFPTLSIATQGYCAFTRDEVAAAARTEPTVPQSFAARLRFPDGREATFRLAGDELYVDAHILKWKPIATSLALHTAHELDRVAGRWSKLADEHAKTRTVFALSPDKVLDIFHLRRRYSLLRPILDAEYGSPTFIAAKDLRGSNCGFPPRGS
jgi:hypothetical protein